MTTHFRGGYEPITYSTSMEDQSTSVFTGEIDKDTGMLTIKLRVATTTSPANQYELSTTATEANAITVTATDSEGNTADRIVHVLTNKAPVADTPGTAWGVNVGTEVRAEKMVVACLATPADVDDANTVHQCTVEGAGSGIFTDDNTNDFVLTVMSTSSKATVSADGKTLTITGLESTWDATLDTAAHVPAEVMIRATDKGGLYAERTLQITVDGAPTVKSQIANRTYEDDGVAKVAARNIHLFFSDVETTLAATDVTTPAESSDANVATAAVNGSNLEVTPLNPGTTMITVKIDESDGYEQAVSQTFMVTVTNANP